MRKDFLWGGYNVGGRGLYINYVEMGSINGKLREIHETIKE